MERKSSDKLNSLSKHPSDSTKDTGSSFFWEIDSEINLDEEDECDGDSQDNDRLNLSKDILPDIDTNSDKNQLQQIKERNREHAKNTRIRRKNYIETLKDQVINIYKDRDSREIEKKSTLRTLADKTMQRKAVLERWFQYRTSMECDLAKWRDILEEDFQCIMPVTPYRSFPPYQVQNGRRKVTGVAEMVFDCLSLHVMLRSCITPRSPTHLPKVTLRYEVSEQSIMSANTCMCKWRLSTDDLVARGAMFEVSKQGMLLAVYSSQNKLQSLELSFDVMSFMQQLKRSTVRDFFQVVPNTVYTGHIQEKTTDNIPTSTSINSMKTAKDEYTSQILSNTSNRYDQVSIEVAATTNSYQEIEALVLFMTANQPKAVITATAPYSFLYSNEKFITIFQQQQQQQRTNKKHFTTTSNSATFTATTTDNTTDNNDQTKASSLFTSFVRVQDNALSRTTEIHDFIQNKQPCTAVLNCSTDGDPPTILPCLCCFYPLFGHGTVQQYLLTLEVIPAATMRLTSEALDQRATAAPSLQQPLADKHCAPSLTGSMNSSNSGETQGAPSSGSGMTDQASGSSDSPTEMEVVSPPVHDHHHKGERHHTNKRDRHVSQSMKSSLSLLSTVASLTSHSTSTDLQASEFNSSSAGDGESTMGSEDRWIRDYVQSHLNQDLSSTCHSLNPSVASRESLMLSRHNLQEPVAGANKSTRVSRENTSTTEMSSTSALSDSGSGGNNSSRMELGSSGNDSGSDNGRGSGSGGQSPPGGSDSLSSDQMQVMSTERSSPSVSSGSGNGSPGHSAGEGDKGPRSGSEDSTGSGSQKSGSVNSADGMKKKKDRDGHAMKKRHTNSSSTTMSIHPSTSTNTTTTSSTNITSDTSTYIHTNQYKKNSESSTN